LRFSGERHGNHDALFHAAGKLKRVFVHAALRIGNANLLQQFLDTRLRSFAWQIQVLFQHFFDLFRDGHNRIKTQHRFLKNHTDALAADFAHFPFG